MEEKEERVKSGKGVVEVKRKVKLIVKCLSSLSEDQAHLEG